MEDQRFEIRLTQPGEYGRLAGVAIYYDVWDAVKGMRVPFGRYRLKADAERRLARERTKEAP